MVLDTPFNVQEMYFKNNESFEFDKLYDQSRDRVVIPGEKFPIPIVFSDLSFKPYYYIGILIFYKDLAGNLFDTQIIVRVAFQDPPKEINGKIESKIIIPNCFTNYKLHTYSNEDQKKLLDVTKEQNWSLHRALSTE